MAQALARRWCQWLRAAGLSAAHIATVLDLEPSAVDTYLSLPAPARPTIPRQRGSGKKVRGPTGTKVQRLMTLGYVPAAIAHYLSLPLSVVADFARRAAPQRSGAPIVRVRDRQEQRRMQSNAERRAERRRRREAPNSQRNAWTQGDWRFRDDIGPDGLVTVAAPAAAPELASAPPALPPADPLPAAAAPLPLPSVWVDEPVRRSQRLPDATIETIRQRLLAGATWAAMAREYDVSQNTIRRYITTSEVGRRKVRIPYPTEAVKLGGCVVRWDEPLGMDKSEHRTVRVICECGRCRHVRTRIVLGTDDSPFTGLCSGCEPRSRVGTVRGRTVNFELSAPDKQRGGR